MSIEWKRVTWYSQIVAIVLFVAVFFLGFYFGRSSAPMQEPTVSQSGETSSAADPNTVIASAGFFCDGGKSIRAVFTDAAVDLTLSDGRTMNLAHAVSADGGRYTNSDESFVFWTKGQGAFITENGTTTYANCIVAAQ